MALELQAFESLALPLVFYIENQLFVASDQVFEPSENRLETRKVHAHLLTLEAIGHSDHEIFMHHVPMLFRGYSVVVTLEFLC